MSTHPVFFDPHGKRKRFLTRFTALGGLAAAVLTTAFWLSLLVIPLLPRVPWLTGATASRRALLPEMPRRERHVSRYLLRRSRAQLYHEIARTQPARVAAAPRAAVPPAIVAAFYAPWQETGLHSLRAHAAGLTHLMPEWLHLNRTGDGLDTRDWNPASTPHNRDVLQIARAHHLQIMPILNNSEGGFFDPQRVHRLLASPAKQRRLALALRGWLRQQRFQGVNLDMENLQAADYPRLIPLLRIFRQTLNPAGLALSVDVEAGNETLPLHALADTCTFVVMMAYDQHFSSGTPGPVASISWTQQVLARAVQAIPADKLVLGIGNYAYDWPTHGPAESLTYQDALIRARDYGGDTGAAHLVNFDPVALNPTFNYTDDQGRDHEVWMLDAVTAYNQWLLGNRMHLRGAAVWALGSEDPSLWSFLRRDRLSHPPTAEKLATVQFPYDVEYEGEGEILAVRFRPQQGRRTLEPDTRTGLITDMDYQSFPASFVIRREGYQRHKIALTFDDGPNPVYTPQILSVLRRYHVPATFFMIGESADAHPALVRQVWDAGHEIGSHTFTHPNMGAVSDRRGTLELNTTQRALQSILGRSTVLFRPPYNADAEPTSAEEVKPLLLASRLGYLTIGEMIDPQDWNLWRSGPHGTRVRRTAAEITAEVFQELPHVTGNVILLHDGGGNRAVTIQALNQIIPRLQQRGYTFVPVSQLAGLSRATVMPPLTRKDTLLVGYDRLAFGTLFTLERLLTLAFIIAILLGIGRVLLIIPLALLAERRPLPDLPAGTDLPLVSVLIAAYNEAPVIVRTLRSLLRSEYPNLEVVVVDDGSTDGTAEAVASAFSAEPRVRLLRQENSGKAAALNLAIAKAHGPVLMCLDADTQIAPDCIGQLVRHFQDPTVGAVAGNVKVGNRHNLLTRWQAIEYITSQNLDREAYALLNAITVVPGAVGAWRRQAVLDAGGYLHDTLAEDMDLTWRIRRQGWRVETDRSALGYTEVPDTLGAFCKQRFRWAYGTLQCLWKHRDALGHYGFFGRLALPTLWIFQILFQVLAPLVDLRVAVTLGSFGIAWLSHGVLHQDWQPLPGMMHVLTQTLFSYAVFFTFELGGSLVAFRMDRERPGILWWLFWQRFVYRQLMYFVVWKSLWTALKGTRQGWGKLERKGTVLLAELLGDTTTAPDGE